MDSFYERHVLHSLGIAKVMDFQEGTSVLDVGTWQFVGAIKGMTKSCLEVNKGCS